MGQVIFVRHGETGHNLRGIISSAMPGPHLNATGREQAERLASALAATPFDAVHCSPLARARETAESLCRSRGSVPAIRPELREVMVGDLEGHTGPDAFARYHAVLDSWIMGRDLDRPLGTTGEAGWQALARIEAFLREVGRDHPDGTTLAVCHGSIMQFALSRLAGLDPDWVLARPVPNGRTALFVTGPAGLTCREWSGERPAADRPTRP